MLLQVHDELVFEVPDSEVEATIEVVRKVMADAPHPLFAARGALAGRCQGRAKLGRGALSEFDVATCVTPEFDPLSETATLEGINFAGRLTLHQPLQNLFQIDFALERTGLAALELDPACVEAIEHLDARRRIFHALRCK